MPSATASALLKRSSCPQSHAPNTCNSRPAGCRLNANILSKHRKELEAHIRARAAESAHYQSMKHKDEKMAMARERLEAFRQKNKPFDLAEELEAMKQNAIRLGFRQPDSELDQPTGH